MPAVMRPFAVSTAATCYYWLLLILKVESKFVAGLVAYTLSNKQHQGTDENMTESISSITVLRPLQYRSTCVSQQDGAENQLA